MTRIAIRPMMPPVTTTHVTRDTATATRIESIENIRLIASTRTTVAQYSDSPNIAVAFFAPRRCPALRLAKCA